MSEPSPDYIFGHIHRVRVSASEEQSIAEFVPAYLESRGWPATPDVVRALHTHLAQYPHQGAVERDVLAAWLDARLRRQRP